jgi:alpha-1,2-mannosyltransferase
MGARGVATLQEGRDHRPVADRSNRAAGARGAAGLGLIVLLVYGFCLVTVAHGKPNFDVYRIDLDVYRLGAHAWLTGHNLYGPLPPTRNGLNLGFTYPPISAVAMAPLAVVPARLAGILMTGVTLGLMMAVVALFLRTAGLAGRGRSWKLAALLLPLAVLVEPVRTTLAYGQINVVLMALVSFDCLLPETWWTLPQAWPLVGGRRIGWPRGALVGAAAALKLTPAVFVLFFVARRDWRAALTTAASFVAVTGIGALLAPHDSVRYWTTTVFDTGRIGPLEFAGNQSLNGMLYRAHLTGGAEQAAWFALAVAVGVLGLVAVGRAARAGRPLLALGLTACVTLLVSPVSWSHHWVWAAPIMITAALAAYRAKDRRALALAAGGLALFLASPQWWFPGTAGRELHWGWWEQVVGSAYVWLALGVLLASAFGYAPNLLPAETP